MARPPFTRRRPGPGPNPENPALCATLSRTNIRHLALNLRGLEHPMSYMLVVGSRSMSGAAVELARTDLFRPVHGGALGAFGGTHLPSSVEGAGFEYTTLRGNADALELETLHWFISEPDFLFLALPRIVVFDQIRVQVVSDPLVYLEVD